MRMKAELPFQVKDPLSDSDGFDEGPLTSNINYLSSQRCSLSCLVFQWYFICHIHGGTLKFIFVL